jgi:hypothetical protein
MKKLTLVLLFVATICMQMGLKAQRAPKLTNKETALNMYISDTMCRTIYKNLAKFVETKDSSYFNHAQQVFNKLNDCNKIAKNGVPDSLWSKFFEMNYSRKKTEFVDMKKSYFNNKDFLKSTLYDTESTSVIKCHFAKASNAKSDKIPGPQVTCSASRKADYDHLIEHYEEATQYLLKSIGIIKPYLVAK